MVTGARTAALAAQYESLPRAVGSVSPLPGRKILVARLGDSFVDILSVGMPFFLRYALLQAYRAQPYWDPLSGVNA